MVSLIVPLYGKIENKIFRTKSNASKIDYTFKYHKMQKEERQQQKNPQKTKNCQCFVFHPMYILYYGSGEI